MRIESGTNQTKLDANQEINRINEELLLHPQDLSAQALFTRLLELNKYTLLTTKGNPSALRFGIFSNLTTVLIAFNNSGQCSLEKQEDQIIHDTLTQMYSRYLESVAEEITPPETQAPAELPIYGESPLLIIDV